MRFVAVTDKGNNKTGQSFSKVLLILVMLALLKPSSSLHIQPSSHN